MLLGGPAVELRPGTNSHAGVPFGAPYSLGLSLAGARVPHAHAVADHGVVKPGIVQASYQQAQQVLNGLAAVGIDMDDVTATLEREGVEKFEASWLELQKSVETQLGAAA